MKRLISIILLIATLFTFASPLAGCSAKNDTVLTVGQWLMMINDAFGMQSYIEEKPYFENISSSSPYYETVQIAAEWDVVDKNAAIDVEKTLTWETALVTLVNAGNFVDAESGNEKKVKYAIENFDESIRDYWMNRNIQYQKAVVLLATAQEKWANKRYDENIENISYNENVIDLADSVKTDYAVNGNQVAISSELVGEIEEGDVYVLQSQDNPLEYTYYKAEQISTSNGTTYISNSDEELELEDVAEEIQLQGTIIPTAENTVICDGNGNVIGGPSVVNQEYTGGTPKVELLGYTPTALSNKHTFKIDGYEISLSYDLNGEIDMKIEVETDNLLPKDKPGELKAAASFAINQLKVSHDFDFGIVKGLKSAMLKVDYEVQNEFGASYSGKPIDLVAAPKYSNGNGKFLTNFKRAVMKDRGSSGAQTIASKKTIKICSLNIYNAGVAKICLDVNLQVALDGSFTVSITYSGTSGVEYKNGNLRFIKSNKKSVEAELKAKAEVTLGFGPALYLVGLKKQLLGIEARLGVGAKASVKWHLADAEMHLIEEMNLSGDPPEDYQGVGNITIEADAEAIQAVAAAQGGVYTAQAGARINLHVDTCLDVDIYGILRFGLTDSSYAAKFIGGKVTTTCTVLSDKNCTFFNYHVDNWAFANGVVTWGKAASEDNCTLKYVPFDSAEEETESTETTETGTTDGTESTGPLVDGNFIILSEVWADVAVGDKYCITISQLPEGYGLENIVYETANSKVATVSAKGVVTGVAEGDTVITVKTADGRCFAAIAISVSAGTVVEFEGIEV